MIRIPEIAQKTYGVVGLGKSGRATVASLLASGANVVAWDDNEATRAAVQQEFAAVKICPVAEWNFASFAGLVMSPGIPLIHPAIAAAKKHHVEVIGDVELLQRAAPLARYVAITGTNGKSTTTTLVAHILKSCGKRVEVGGNLGIPALALAPLGADGIYVLELSSYQLDLVRTTRFQVALLLNISPDHIDHHGSMENYVEAKRHIFARQQSGDAAIIGVDDAYSEAICREMIALKKQRVFPVSVTQKTSQGVFVRHARLQAGDFQASIAGITSLQGEHNWQNAAAAFAAAAMCGCAPDAIMAAMKTYPGLAHRMQWLGETGGVQFVNDSKATNADAAEKALKTYDNIYWIAGGVAKEGGIAPLAKYFPKIRHAYLIGEAAKDFAHTLAGSVAYTMCETLDKAFAAAAADAAKNENHTKCVLLSPACASFDQYANFEKRGEAFVALYEDYKAKEKTHAATA